MNANTLPEPVVFILFGLGLIWCFALLLLPFVLWQAANATQRMEKLMRRIADDVLAELRRLR